MLAPVGDGAETAIVFHVRLKLTALIILVAMAFVAMRLGYMQIFRAEHYRQEGRERRIRVKFPDAPRGRILASDGTVLAEDRPVLSVCVVLKEVDGVSPRPPLESPSGTAVEFSKVEAFDPAEYEAWCGSVAALVGDSVEAVKARIDDARAEIENEIGVRRRQILAAGADKASLVAQARLEERLLRNSLCAEARILYEDVPFEIAARAEVAAADMPGLAVTESLKRMYRDESLAAHVVGYTNQITPREYELYKYDYREDESKRVFFHDTTGRTGIEEYYNFELRGSRGRREEVINAYGQVQRVLSEERPVEGRTITLTIDPRIQKAAEAALAKAFAELDCPGAAVCLDVRTGAVLAMVSYPAYDPNNVTRDYAELLDTDGFGRYRPLLNRATAGQYPLGSVFKIVTATAALESFTITPDTVHTCTGAFRLGRRDFRCWIAYTAARAHGPLNLYEAIKQSCNVYFNTVGLASGGPALVEWGVRYGFGKRAGIDLPGEAAGRIDVARQAGDVVNLSIGQGTLLVTPLQVARMVGAVANGGTLVDVHLVKADEGGPGRSVGLQRSTLEALHKGLYKVVNETGGTGYRPVRSKMTVIAGKTGTAQAPPKGDHAWFAGYAPFDDPRIAFAVVIEHGGHGGAEAGPVAKAIAEAWARGQRRE